MEATIKFKNGTELTAQKNGDSFYTAEKPTIPNDLRDLQIVTEEGTQTFGEAMFVECACIDANYWFNFIEKPLEVKQAEKIAELEEKNEFLEGCIMEMSEEVYK